jgi:prepilin-type N-terminal cleavage/methylation domain-containing protein
MMNARQPKGFTLVEMIVSIGIFALVMMVATSAYFTLISLDRRARATNQVVSNLSFAVDSMIRGIRTGTGYHCYNGSPDADGNSISGACTQFYYTDTNLTAPNNVVTFYKETSDGTIRKCISSAVCITGGSVLTDPAITISSVVFYVRGAGSANDMQPQVLFTIKGAMPADSSGSTATFVLEEAATQRLIDL